MRASTRLFCILTLALAVGLAAAVSPYASASPDGLERVARDKGFSDQGSVQALQERSPAPGYAFPGVENERLATGLAGFAGTLAVFAVGFGLARLARRSPPSGAPGAA